MPARSHWVVIAAVTVLSGCATSPELVSCLDPNRRVAVEVPGFKVTPPPKAAEGEKPGKPGRQNVTMNVQVQGSSAWAVSETGAWAREPTLSLRPRVNL